ncbi:disulfide bond formation protein B [Pseudomonas sp. NPDC090202]|uniref:disulfide bond formation protein B n=1 Tax=unclassified Pseudomonas TaxID=196821 RepID=UPI00382F08F7
MHLARTRSLFFLASFACVLIMGVVVYLERVIGVMPCPLCYVQRALLFSFSIVCLLATVHSPGRAGWRVYSGVLLLVASMGAAAAARQVWLQASPPENMESCLDSLQHLIDTESWLNVMTSILAGSAGCNEITWSLFGISLPEWSLLAFAGASLFALYYLCIEFRLPRPVDSGASD